MAPVRAGAKLTMPVIAPISRAWGVRSQASEAMVTTMVIRPVLTGSRRAMAGLPYTTAAYIRSVKITTVARLPTVNWSAITPTVPTARVVRGRVRRSSSIAPRATRGTRAAQAGRKPRPGLL